MVLIKVADISNEARPMDVAEPWLDCLLTEFYEQSDAEKQLGLPVTPFMDRDKMSKPSSQCAFIGYVLLPLFESIGKLYPELEVFNSLSSNLLSIIVSDHYKRSNELPPPPQLSVLDVLDFKYRLHMFNINLIIRSRKAFENSKEGFYFISSSRLHVLASQ